MNDFHGYDAEDTLEEVCYKMFGKDLVLRSPILMEKNGDKELTDFLIIIDDIAIIIQSKSMLIDISDLTEVKLNRIVNRQKKAVKQINTTLNAENHNLGVRAETPFGVSFEIDWSKIKHKIGIVTLSINDHEYNDPEFRLQFPYLAEKHKGIQVHTFLLNDLKQIINEITTPADMLHYLDTRFKCVISEKFVIANELDFLGFYKIQYPQLEELLNDDKYQRGLIAPGFWEEYLMTQKDKIKERDNRFKESEPFDKLIRILADSVEFSAERHSYSDQQAAINYMMLIGKLNKISRKERAELGKKIKVKMEKTKKHKWGYFIYISVTYGIAYLFVVLNEEDRNKKLGFLEYLCTEAIHHEHEKYTQMVGIIINGAQDNEFSVDTIIIEDITDVKNNSEPYNDPPMFGPTSYDEINEWD